MEPTITNISAATVEQRASSVGKIALKSGLAVFSGLVLYFFIMSAVGLLKVVELRSFNFFILLSGILYSINCIKNIRGSDFNYFEGLAAGFITTLYSVIPFGIFVFIYLVVTPDFMQYLKENVLFGNTLTPSLAAVVILIEGVVAGAITSFIAMQYFKQFAKKPR